MLGIDWPPDEVGIGGTSGAGGGGDDILKLRVARRGMLGAGEPWIGTSVSPGCGDCAVAPNRRLLGRRSEEDLAAETLPRAVP